MQEKKNVLQGLKVLDFTIALAGAYTAWQFADPGPGGVEMAAARGDKLWKLDAASEIRFSHENPDVQNLYRSYLKTPLGERSHHLLHTEHLPQGKG